MSAVHHLALLAFASWGTLTRAQTPAASQNPCAAPPATQSQPAQCAQTPNPTSQRFPFPEDAAPVSSTPSTPQPAAQPAGNQFPFPEDVPVTPKATAPASQQPGSNTFPFPENNAGSSSSSSSSSDSSDVVPDLPKPGEKGSHGIAKPVPQQNIDDRIAEDVEVANFYRNGGNYKGAYLRAKDAMDHAPDDPDITFLLAEVEQQLGKKEDALEHYKAYLKLNPKAPRSKTEVAQKAIQQLSSLKK